MTRFSIARSLLLAATLAAPNPTSAAQVQFRISGEVRDARTHAVVPHAIIRGTDGSTVRSNDSGWFTLTIPSATDTVRVRALGYRQLVTLVMAGREPLTLHLDPAPIHLDDIVVTGARRVQRASEVTVSLDVVDAEEISAAGSPRVSDILTEQAGLQLSPGHPTGENIMIRGIGDSRVLVLIDGEPASGTVIENRDLSRLSTLAVERIEVVKGPMSVLYGSQALGGVINIITTDAPTGLHQQLEGRLGGDGRTELAGTLSGGGRVRYRVSGGMRRQEWTPGVAEDNGTLSRLWDLRTTIRADVSQSIAVRADANYVRERQRWPVTSGFNGFNDNWGITTWVEGATTGDIGTWTIRAFYQTYEHLFRQSRGDIPIADTGSPVQREEFVKSRLQWSRPFGNHQLDAGVEVGKREIESPDRILDDRASDAQVEAYLQNTWTLRRFIITGGARLTDNDRWGRALTPSIGVAWETTDQLRVRGTIGRGFRGPSFKELAWNFSNPQGGYTVQGNQNLEPERSWHTSLEINWSPTNAWRFTAEAFRNDIDNLIEQEFVGNTPAGFLIFSPSNVARARTQGFEFGGSWTGDVFQLETDYTYLDARDLEHDLPLNRRSEHLGRILGSAHWTLGTRDITLTASARYTGAAPLVGTDDAGALAVVDNQDPLMTFDGQIRIGVIGNAVAVELGIDNALNSQPAGWPGVVQRRAYVGVVARR